MRNRGKFTFIPFFLTQNGVSRRHYISNHDLARHIPPSHPPVLSYRELAVFPAIILSKEGNTTVPYRLGFILFHFHRSHFTHLSDHIMHSKHPPVVVMWGCWTKKRWSYRACKHALDFLRQGTNQCACIEPKRKSKKKIEKKKNEPFSTNGLEVIDRRILHPPRVSTDQDW